MSTISIRIKVFLLFAAAALVTVVPALVLIAQGVADEVYRSGVEALYEADELLNSQLELQDRALVNTARGFAERQGVAEQLMLGDSTALRRNLESAAAGRPETAFAVDSSGTLMVGAIPGSVFVDSERTAVILPVGSDAPIRVAMWPVVTDSGYSAGMVGVTRRLDAEAISELLVGAADIALVAGDTVVATTLPDSLVRVLGTMDLRAVMSRTGIHQQVVERLPYLYWARPLSENVGVLLLRPVAEELRVARSIRSVVVGIGATALLVALALAFIVSRIVARPAQALAAAAGELALGNYDAPLPEASGDEIGQLTMAFGEMRSAIAERETRLRAAQAELIHREKLAAMGRLVAQLSHEINNPIYNIQNCLEVLDRRGDPADPNREFLTLAREELERMANLTRQLLDQSRPLSDAARELDLNQIVSRVMTLAATEIAARQVTVRLELDPSLPLVVAHPDAMQQVMANLVANAIDAMPAGGTLTISTSADDNVVEVSVADTGAGIADEHLPHIFEAFYTTKPGVTGLGLGLFVSEGIVRGHRGELRVESSIGLGTRFVMRLPRDTLDAQAPEARDLAAAGSS